MTVTPVDPTVRESRARIRRRIAERTVTLIGFRALVAACTARPIGIAGSTPVAISSGTITPSTDSGEALLAKLDAVGNAWLARECNRDPRQFALDTIRSDVREDRPGAALSLALRVQDEHRAAIPGAVVEIWHGDAGPLRSDELLLAGAEVAVPADRLAGAAEPPSAPTRSALTATVAPPDTDLDAYVYGAQVADDHGVVQFHTIWPSWHYGRTVHIHVKVQVNSETVLSAQLWFDDVMNNQVLAESPYGSRGPRDTFNDGDTIIDPTGKLTVEAHNEGYLAYTNLGVRA